MDSFLPLLLLSACSCAFSEPLSAAIQRRSDIGVYASDFTRNYEPIAYIAIPLHKPLPVLHVLTNSPSSPTQEYKQTYKRSPQPQRYMYPPQPTTQPQYGQRVYASSMAHSWYAKPTQETPEELRIPPPQPLIFLTQPNPSNEEPVVLYAKPDKYGGYSYRKKPTNKTKPKREPIIIRVHKYRIIKDDR